MYRRVFTTRDDQPQPADLQADLRAAGFDAPLHVKGDELGWTSAEIPLSEPLQLERYLAEEDDLRDELDTWAAVAESWGADGALLERLVNTRQLITIRAAADSPAGELAARILATRLAGIYHADGRGFHRADGSLLLSGD